MNTVDCLHWIDRFDRMQERYVHARSERFEVIVSTIRAVVGRPGRVLDLGCGTGSLGLAVLEAFDQCHLVGIDLDESLLALARARLEPFGSRVSLLKDDLRGPSWTAAVGGGFDAVVSATALHWLSAEHLAKLYNRLCAILRPGGIFINADHVGSGRPDIQDAWDNSKKTWMQSQPAGADSWSEFWQAYAAALHADEGKMGENAVGAWEGVEQGMPLAWHFDQLWSGGFVDLDCYWRRDGDAIYGGVLATG